MSLVTNKLTNKQEYLRYFLRFKQLTQRPEAKVSGLVTLTIFTISFFGIFAILPTFQTIAELNRKIENAELVSTKLNQKIVALNKAEEEYLIISPQLPLVDQVIPQEAEFERLAWQINWLINNTGLNLAGGSFGEFFLKNGPVDDQLTGLPVEISLSGSYQQIKTLIDRLVKIDRLITIEDVSISNKKSVPGSENITASVKITAYYLP